MKALTLLQPWASPMVTRWESGRFCKMFETRSWKTEYRGPIAIHASARYPKGIAELVCTEPFFSAFGRPGHGQGGVIVDMTPAMPTGVVLGVGRLVDCLPTEKAKSRLLEYEEDFGDYSAGRFAWLIEDMQPFKAPVPAKGKLGLWEWEPSEEAKTIRRQFWSIGWRVG